MKETHPVKIVKVQRYNKYSAKLSIPDRTESNYYERHIYEDGRIEFIPVEFFKHGYGVERDV